MALQVWWFSNIIAAVVFYSLLLLYCTLLVRITHSRYTKHIQSATFDGRALESLIHFFSNEVSMIYICSDSGRAQGPC